MRVRARVLGCGPSSGAPAIGGVWGRLDPGNARNRRLRCSLLVEWGATRVLVDTSPDLRAQLLAAGVSSIDAVVYTHAHADHIHGIDDLRFVARGRRGPIPAYGSPEAMAAIRERFLYVFSHGAAESGYPPFLSAQEIGGPFTLDRLPVTGFGMAHGLVRTLGFRFGPIAYCPDVVELNEAAFAVLSGVKVWIVDCFRYEPHFTHAHLAKALEWIARVGPERAVLTHLSLALDYEELKARCPPGVEPAFDGMVIEADG